MSTILKSMQERFFEFIMVFFTVDKWYYRIIFRMPQVYFRYLVGYIFQLLGIYSKSCCRFSLQSSIIKNGWDEMEKVYMTRKNILREVFGQKYTPKRMSYKYEFVISNILEIFLEPDFPCWIIAILCIWHSNSDSLKVIRKSREKPSFPALVAFTHIERIWF